MVSKNKENLKIEWSDGFKSEFAAVWLKDNCPHPRTTHQESFGRLLLMSNLNTEITIDQVYQVSLLVISIITLNGGFRLVNKTYRFQMV